MSSSLGPPRSFGQSLRSKILLLILLAFAPAVLLNLVAGWENRQEAIHDAQEDALSLVRLAARDHEELIFRATPPLLRTLAELYPEVQAQDAPRISALFARILTRYPQYNAVLIAKVPSGDVFASGAPLPRPLNLSDRPYFQRAVRTGAYAIGEFAIGRASGRPTLVCAQPVCDSRGAVRSVIATGINLQRLAGELTRSRQPRGLEVTFFDRSGIVLLTTGSDRSWVGRDVSGTALWRTMRSRRAEGTFRGFGADGGPKLVAFAPLAGPNGAAEAYVTAAMPESVALARAHRFLTHSLFGFAASTAIVLVGLLFIGRRSILRGVDSLITTADRLADGDLHARTGDVGNTKEFQRLACAVDVMAESLWQRGEERRLAELALFREKEHLAVTLRSIGDGVVTTDGAGRVVLLNGMAEALTGWTQDDAAGKPLTDVFRIVNEKTRQPCPNPVERVLDTGAVVELANHTALIARDGREWIIADSAAPIRDRDEQITGVVLVFRDITDQKRSEDALRESEERYRTLVENVDLGIALIDDRYRILASNAAYARMLQRVPSELAGRECFRVVQRRDSRCPECTGAQAMATGRPAAHETGGARSDGTSFWVRVQAFPVLSPDGTAKGFIEVVEDLTEAKRIREERAALEQRMLQAQKLESLGVLAGGIAHDFNNLLVGILGNADLALAKAAADSPVRAHLERIDRAAQRAADLTNQMLAYSGRGRFVVEPIDLSHLVGEMEDLLSTVVAKTAQVRNDLPAGLPPVNADATQVRQVVMNLLTNASDALGGREGFITVSTGMADVDRVRLDATHAAESLSEGPFVYIDVSDTGRGIDAATTTRIFDPFYTTKEQGRGLGLAAVLGIVRGHHGALMVRSEPGRGTSFRVYFPAVSAPAEASAEVEAAPPAEEQRRAFQGTVLVVDDEDGVRSVARDMLEEHGFAVLTAADGAEGVEVFRAHAREIVAVVLDMTMPRMNGEEALRQMRAIEADVPVLLSSGYHEQDAVSRFTGSGAAGFVQKPYRVGTLLDRLAEVIGRRSPGGG